MNKPKHILIVEDELNVAKMLGMRLESYAFQVSIEGTGTEGLAKAKATQPDLIILDIGLPDMSGYEVCKQLKQDPVYKHIPILMLTAKDEDIDKRIGMSSGANGYLTKPYNDKALMHLIEVLLEYSDE